MKAYLLPLEDNIIYYRIRMNPMIAPMAVVMMARVNLKFCVNLHLGCE